MIWSVPEVIFSLSKLLELYPVELIFTSTPAEVRPLKIGDRLEGEVENFAKLKITIV